MAGPGLLAALLACSRSVTTEVPASTVLSPGTLEEPITAVIAAALDADRRLDPADSLWDPEATVVAGGILRYAPPRFAGIEPGGDVAITSTRLEVRQTLVWVYLEYRWLSLRESAAREGKATVLLSPGPEGKGWRITHAHSSTPP
ncbi:MAG: hypothetical protein ACRENB_08210 [Gemmatimonadales bacterium]